MFAETVNLQAGFGDWHLASVTDMEGMFMEASAFNQDIGGWSIGAVIANKLLGDY